ncbi:TadE/TadG family type IV pilus assembly protein [Fulvimarina sp. MAC3]|uniref:TadE/TadG family type IV pilus assembly protein n=1 Tax=Fulvimarina sp. MAC3 TaxID=3148887 RepID=UPI0031FD6627
MSHIVLRRQARPTGTGSLSRFRKDRSGNFAMITALVMPVLFIGAGAALDLVGAEMAKKTMQASLDQAALTAARGAMTEDSSKIRTIASVSFFANMGDERRGDTKIDYHGTVDNNGNRLLQFSATRDYKPVFGSALKTLSNGKLDWETFEIKTTSDIAYEVRSLELAFVLDNSGSMRWKEGIPNVTAPPGLSKLDTLKDAATSLAENLMSVNKPNSTTKRVKVGIVPFSTMVNVGKANQNASWMDRYGESSIHHENLDWQRWVDYDGKKLAQKQGSRRWIRKSDGQVLTRQWIFDNARVVSGNESCSGSFWNRTCKPNPSKTYMDGSKRFPEGWRGCVESRPGSLAISDAPPSSSDPDTYFVPSFAPDERSWNSSMDNDYVSGMFGGAYQEPDEVSSSEWDASGDQPTGQGYSRDSIRRGGQGDVNKYLMSTRSNIYSAADKGPNKGCSTRPVTQLTSDYDTVKTKIDELVAEGATNIAEGLAWGWRVLSPGEPFTEGTAYSDASNLKAIILMTDGANTYNPSYISSGAAVDVSNENDSIFGTFGYASVQNGPNSLKNGRLLQTAGTSDKSGQGLVNAMDTSTKRLCTNVKTENRKPNGNDGILLVTIAFDVDDNSPVKSLLKGCASNSLNDPTKKLYFDAKNKTELLAAFGKITEEISSLRIAR